MISVAGVRGIVGESLTPPVIARFAAAFGRVLPPGPVVVGRDARTSGPLVLHAVAAGLMGTGRDIIDLGLATTPTTQLAVEHLKAAGGIIITASHNPAPWNALKFLSSLGEFLGPAEGQKVRALVESGDDAWVEASRVGREKREPRALEWHLERVLGLTCLDVPRVRARRLKVVVDGCASVGGEAVPALLDDLGADVTEIDCDPDGDFTRELEPLPEHLGALGRAVRAARADFGVAVDPDADRAAFVDAEGTPLGEEYTLALGASVVLPVKAGPIATNLSTSRMIDAVAARYAVPVYRSPVGEAHVVAEMKRRGAVAGGEGNGGMILPDAHYGRDGLVAVALVCEAMASRDTTLRGLANELPRYHMVKEKLELPEEPWERSAERLRSAFRDFAVDTADGLRFSRGDEWLHVRPSGTEPVVRLIAETPSESRTRALIDEARGAVLQRA
jgi:phosphomannomutase